MGLERRTVKISIIVVVVFVIVGAVLSLMLGSILNRPYVELEVWPRLEERPLIQFRPSDPGSWHIWFTKINDFLRAYETSDMSHPCTADHFYGYNYGTPCIFLRLSHIHYWVPEPYNFTSPLPNEMPDHLTHVMKQYQATQYGDFAWVTCGGKYSADEENIGPIHYFPNGLPGFPLERLHTADRIPYASRNLSDQVPAPVMAVFFENPRRGVLINVECRVWTRDLYHYDRSSRYGRASFELFIY